MKKVYLKGYLYKNLGDDLFFKIITERYPNVEFCSISKYKYNCKNNLKIYKKNKILNKLLMLFTKNKLSQERMIIDKCDFSIIIGGSIFIQGKSSYDKYIFTNGKKYFILGSNFGPYQSKDFYEEYEKIFKNAQDVCFRERKSYNLFKKLTNVRVASDIVLSFDMSNLIFNNEKRVVISVIDLTGRFDERICNLYTNKLIDIINYFFGKKYKITLMSFCKDEGDERAIKRILCNIKNVKLRDNIDIYNYNGNIDDALSIMSKSEIIIGSRFHANILGLVMNKVIIPIAYSDKTINVLNDLNFAGKIIDVRKIEEFDINDFTEKDLNYKLDICEYKTDAEKHFKKLDEILK